MTMRWRKHSLLRSNKEEAYRKEYTSEDGFRKSVQRFIQFYNGGISADFQFGKAKKNYVDCLHWVA